MLLRSALRAALVLTTSAVLAGVAPVAATAAEPDRGIGIRLLEAPTDRADDPRALASVIDHVEPGTSFSRKLEVVNDTGAVVTVQTYTGSAQVVDGAFVDDPGTGTGDLARWARVDKDSARLPPRGTSPLQLTIDVPDDAADGERYGVVWVEARADAGAVTQVNRIGIRIYLSVGEGTEPTSDFTVDALTASRDAEGNPVVEATVTNTGGRALDMSGTLSLTEGPGGLSAGPFPAKLGTTLGIGESQPVRVVLDKALPAGPWKARIDLRSGLVERAAEGVITFPEAAGEVSEPVVATAVPLTQDFDFMVPVAGGLIGLALLGLLWLLRQRHLRPRRRDDDEVPATTLPTQRKPADDRVVS